MAADEPAGLSHVDERGAARMVDVSGKAITVREAVAEGHVHMQPETLALIQEGGLPKGDVLAVARVAGIQGAKRTSDLIPMCHPLTLESVEVQAALEDDSTVRIESRVRCEGKTGVEMEAMTAASVAALTVYDMCKSAGKGIEITSIRLLEKRGGKSGSWKRGK